MPDLNDLLKIAEEKQKKRFSRGNRPDALINQSSNLNNNSTANQEVTIKNNPNQSTYLKVQFQPSDENEFLDIQTNSKFEPVNSIDTDTVDSEKNQIQGLNILNASNSVSNSNEYHNSHPTNNNAPMAAIEFSNNSVTNAERFRNNSVSDSVTIPKQLRNDFVTDYKAINNSIDKSSNNSVTNAERFRNNSVSDSVTIPKQLRNDFVTDYKAINNSIDKSSNNSVTNAERFRNNSVSDSVTNSVTNAERFRNKFITKKQISLKELSGHKLKLIQVIFSFCHEKGSIETGPISKDIFIFKTGFNSEIIRTTANRLIDDGYIDRVSSKRGVGGYSNYRLNNSIYNECINYFFRSNSVTNAERFRNDSVSDSVTQNVTNPPSKIDSNNNILTNYTREGVGTLSAQPSNHNAWFKDLDFSRLPNIRPMMVNSAIRRQVEEKLDRDDVQMFIFKFTNWLTAQHKVQNPVAIFCEKLKEWCSEGSTDVLYALSDEELEAERFFVKEQQDRQSHITKLNELKEKARSENANREFENWYNNASDEELLSYQAPSNVMKFKGELYKNSMRAIYAEKFNNEEF